MQRQADAIFRERPFLCPPSACQVDAIFAAAAASQRMPARQRRTPQHASAACPQPNAATRRMSRRRSCASVTREETRAGMSARCRTRRSQPRHARRCRAKGFPSFSCWRGASCPCFMCTVGSQQDAACPGSAPATPGDRQRQRCARPESPFLSSKAGGRREAWCCAFSQQQTVSHHVVKEVLTG